MAGLRRALSCLAIVAAAAAAVRLTYNSKVDNTKKGLPRQIGAPPREGQRRARRDGAADVVTSLEPPLDARVRFRRAARWKREGYPAVAKHAF